MGSGSVALDNKPFFVAYNGPAKKGNKPQQGKQVSEKGSESNEQGCLIKGKPDLYQPMDKNESGWVMSNWSNGSVFNCSWKPQNITFNNGVMTLKLTKSDGSYPYDSGEYRTSAEKYSFGYYETRMKAAKGAGLVAGTFFTYRGVWGQKDHNEIDFEVLGKDPTKVQLNYYYAGTGTHSEHEKLIDLGFDASKDFHNYGFVWEKDSIKWFIDGKMVYSVTQDIPQDPCKIMVNFWPGTSEVSGWLNGVYNGSGSQVQYDWIKYVKINEQQQGTNETKQADEPVREAPAGKTIGTTFNDYVKQSNDFNGATTSIGHGQISLTADSNDPGIAMLLKSSVSGKLSFEYSGKVDGGYRNNGFSIIFIKAGPNGDYTKDQQLGEESFTPRNKAEKASIDIPEGTDKINVMLVGKGVIDIKLEHVKIGK
jgi:beta-glucanase (GH16 family)